MGFPEWFKLTTENGHAYKELGNAVCPPVVGVIAVGLLAALTGAGLESRSAVNKKALCVALELVSQASPVVHQPAACWLPPELLSSPR